MQLLLKCISSWKKDKRRWVNVQCTSHLQSQDVFYPLKTSSSCHFDFEGGLCIKQHVRKRSTLKAASEQLSEWNDLFSPVTLNLWQRIHAKKQQNILSFWFHVLKCYGNISATVWSRHRLSVYQLTFSPQWQFNSRAAAASCSSSQVWKLCDWFTNKHSLDKVTTYLKSTW